MNIKKQKSKNIKKLVDESVNRVVTAVGTPNIAFIKYWGKRNEKLILPQNSSLSMTLDENLKTTTSVLFSDKLKSDIFYLENVLQDLNNKDVKERFEIVNMLRKLAKTNKKVLIVSKNSFPTAAGLASSASGIATLVYACKSALKLNLSLKQMSIIARQGSGSSCRSLEGGIVVWKKGLLNNGFDSYIEQIINENYWPELIDIIAIVSKEKKVVSSRLGMKHTIETSRLYKERLQFVEKDLKNIINAIKLKDFQKMGEIIMKDSNSLHSVLLDTYPPIFYLNDVSKAIINSIHELNAKKGRIIAAYTFDAGPNANIITTDNYANEIKNVLKGIPGIVDIITSKIGRGPHLISEKDALIDAKFLQNIFNK